MAIPDFQTLMLPILSYAADGQEHKHRDLIEKLANDFNLSDEERNTLLPSGTQHLFDNRVGWAKTYLKQANLIDVTKRGFFKITERGIKLLEERPATINVRLLKRYPEYIEFKNRRSDKNEEHYETALDLSETPEDLLAKAYRTLRSDLEARLLQQVKELSPAFFERLVVDLLVNMGYGGSREDAGRAIGRSRDGGIDGIINEDRLGLDVVYIQAKRWEGTVGRPEIQKFAGALQGQRARKGIFITTSDFTKDALDYASRIDSRLVLIDGERLARLMVDFNVGVTTIGVYEVKKLDSDYFNEE